MNRPADTLNADPDLNFLFRPGEMRTRIREFDWSATELGAPAGWPSCLKTAMAIMLDCAGPAYIAWGPSFIQFYNDAYIPILGARKHSEAIGQMTSETWQEIWDIVGPQFSQVMESGSAVTMENKLMPLLRHGYLEECYFTYSYSPLTDDAGCVVGVFVMPRETTHEVVNSRRTNAVRMLVQDLSIAENMNGLRSAFEKTVLACPQDLPFGLWYESRPEQTGFDLVAAAGIQRGSALSPETLDPGHEGFYAGMVSSDSPAVSSRTFTDDMLRLECRQPIVNPHALFVKSLYYTNYRRRNGYIVLAANPMRPNDEAQKEFLQTIRLHLENAVRRVSRSNLERRDRIHQFQSIMTSVPCLVWMSDTSKAFIFVNQRWLDFTGRSYGQEMGNGWVDGVHPDDMGEIDRYLKTFDERGTLNLEYRLRHADGGYRWVLAEGTPRHGMNGEFLGYIGTCVDITERKKGEQEVFASQLELRNLYERLQTIREDERSGLAREVHDQLGQILSAAKIDIKLLEEDFEREDNTLSRPEILTELRSARETIDKAIHVVRRLATELRPPELASQGLASAIEWHARDFERRTKIRCSVEFPAEMHELNDAIAIALFRIFQEAMTNILRHAKATHVWITVERHTGEIRLRVLDNGIGISEERARSAGSMGLKGMRERAAIAGGKVIVGPMGHSGTLVSVTVPLERDDNFFHHGMNSDNYTGDMA